VPFVPFLRGWRMAFARWKQYRRKPPKRQDLRAGFRDSARTHGINP